MRLLKPTYGRLTVGVPQFLVNWKHSFLCNRQQRVKIQDNYSDWISPAGSTPQGTKSGPCDFKHMVKDMKVKLPLYKFVDDTTSFEVCQRNSVSTDLQETADDIQGWCQQNHMVINPKKTKEMRIDFARNPPTIQDIVINGQNIEQVKHSKLLGVTISDNLTWNLHVENITKKASQRLFFLRLLKRANVSIDKLVKVYCSLMRSVLEYACQIYHGGLTKTHLEKIESILRFLILHSLVMNER